MSDIRARAVDRVPPRIVEIIATRPPFHRVIDMRWRVIIRRTPPPRRTKRDRATFREDTVRSCGGWQGRPPRQHCRIKNQLTILIGIQPLLREADNDHLAARPPCRSSRKARKRRSRGLCYLRMSALIASERFQAGSHKHGQKYNRKPEVTPLLYTIFHVLFSPAE